MYFTNFKTNKLFIDSQKYLKKTNLVIKVLFVCFAFLKTTTLSFAIQKDQQKGGHFSSQPAQKTSEAMAKELVDRLKQLALDFDIDVSHQMQKSGQPAHIYKKQKPVDNGALKEKLIKQIESQAPLEFYLLAFPFKSSNRNLTDESHLPDLADYKCLEHLNQAIESLKQIYPKINLSIILDGDLFADLFEIPAQSVKIYEQTLREIATDLTNLNFISLETILKGQNTTTKNIKQLVLQGIQKKPKQKSPQINGKKKDMMQRIQLEIDHKDHSFFYLSQNEKEKQLKAIANILTARNRHLLDAVKKYVPESSFLLSAHYQKTMHPKIGIQLHPKAKILPWFAVLVRNQDGQDNIIPKSDIDHASLKKRTIVKHNHNLSYYTY